MWWTTVTVRYLRAGFVTAASSFRLSCRPPLPEDEAAGPSPEPVQGASHASSLEATHWPFYLERFLTLHFSHLLSDKI